LILSDRADRDLNVVFQYPTNTQPEDIRSCYKVYVSSYPSYIATNKADCASSVIASRYDVRYQPLSKVRREDEFGTGASKVILTKYKAIHQVANLERTETHGKTKTYSTYTVRCALCNYCTTIAGLVCKS
jgi:hypothetical protein